MAMPKDVHTYVGKLMESLQETPLYLEVCIENQIDNQIKFDAILIRKLETASYDNYCQYDAPEITPNQLSGCMASAILEYQAAQQIALNTFEKDETNLLKDHEALRSIFSKINPN